MTSWGHQLLLFVVLIVVTLVTVGHSRNFHGFQVLRVNATSPEGLKILGELYEEDTRIDFWTVPSGQRGTDIMVPLDHLDDLKEYLSSENIPFTVMIGDVQRILIEEQSEAKGQTTAENGELNWNSYHPFDTISHWLDQLAQDYPEICKMEIIGQSTEGRPMKLIKISKGGTSDGDKERKAIWIDGGIHAREWISVATVTYIINELVTNKNQYNDFLSKVDFYILPIMNPDGYAFTWTQDRMWRKTRSDHSTLFSFSDCRGVDPNRNFGYRYGGAGTSDNKCSDIYRGPSAFSEPETQAVRDYIENSPANFLAYLTLHSYSQAWVYPWGYGSELPSDWEDLDSLARAGAAAIEKRYGTKYTCGSSTNVLYAAAGGSDDWAKSKNIKYSYTIELRDTGHYGFLLPSSQIKPTAEETWDGIQVVAHHIANLK